MNSITQRKQSETQVFSNIDPFETFADQAIGIDAQLVKFTRGVWTTGTDGETIAADARFLAVITGLRHGFIKWEDSRPVERRMVPVADHPMPPSRGELGDRDETLWPIGKDGVRADPWIFTYELPLVDLETDGARLFSTSSAGGRQAIGKLARTYAQHGRKTPGQLPAIELGCESYKHESYGVIQKPFFRIVDWMPDPDYVPPKPASGGPGNIDDEIPFACEWR